MRFLVAGGFDGLSDVACTSVTEEGSDTSEFVDEAVAMKLQDRPGDEVKSL